MGKRKKEKKRKLTKEKQKRSELKRRSFVRLGLRCKLGHVGRYNVKVCVLHLIAQLCDDVNKIGKCLEMNVERK